MRIGGQRDAAKHVKRNTTAAIAAARARRVLGWGAVLICCFTLFYGVLTQRTYAAEDAEGQAVVQSDGSSTYTVDVALPDSEDKIAVEVNAPEGALPEGAELHAELLSDEADTKAVADELDKADVIYDGFTALDVHFTNADGEEIEPTGTVDVKFELPQAALGDDMDASTLAVQHFAEDENGDVTKVDAVADTDDATQGTVETTDDKATADFTVDSFSTFTITWNNNNAEQIHIIDSDGNEIGSGSLGSMSISNATTIEDVVSRISSSQQGSQLNGYTFYRAVAANSARNALTTDASVFGIRRNTSGSSYNRDWQYNTGNDNSGQADWNNLGNNNLYLIYNKNDEPVKVYVYVAGTGLSDECLDLLGIDPDTLDANGYFPAGEIYLDQSYFDGKSGVNTPGEPLINSESDWNQLVKALENMNTSTLIDMSTREWSNYSGMGRDWRGQVTGNVDYTSNQNNHVANYLSQAIWDGSYTWGSMHTALFHWHMNPAEQGNANYGFEDQTVQYHLDLFFTTNTITFKYGYNGIESGQYRDLNNAVDPRTYITGSPIQDPGAIPVPQGYSIEGYYTDPDFSPNSRWNGIGDPLTKDEVVYIKLTENKTLSPLVIQKETAGYDVENKDFSFTIATKNSEVAGEKYSVSGDVGEDDSITFSSDADGDGYYTASVTINDVTAQDGIDGTVYVWNLPVGVDYTITEDADSAEIEGYSCAASYKVNGEDAGTSGATVTTVADQYNSATVQVTNTYEKTRTGSLTIVKDIYGLNHEQVVKYVEGDLNPKKEGGLRFDVDYFNSKTGAVEDDYTNKEVFKGDWTFDTYQTLKHEDAFVTDKNAVTWEGEITEGSEDIANNEEASHYINSSLKYICVNDGVEHYQYKVTIKDVDLNDWYHVWENHADVVGYELSASVKAVNSSGEVDAEVLHGGRATAFQLTGDTTVTFTNTYTPLATLKIQKYEDTWNADSQNHGVNAGAGKDGEFTAPVNGQNGDTVLQGATFELHNANDTSSDSLVDTVTTGSDGLAIIENLKSGDYWLYETKVPAGYTLLDEPMHIKVDNGVITVAKGSGSLTEPDVSDKTNHVYTVTIENTGISEIPSTGGSGTISAGAVGVAIVVLAGAWLVSKRKGLPKA